MRQVPREHELGVWMSTLRRLPEPLLSGKAVGCIALTVGEHAQGEHRARMSLRRSLREQISSGVLIARTTASVEQELAQHDLGLDDACVRSALQPQACLGQIGIYAAPLD